MPRSVILSFPEICKVLRKEPHALMIPIEPEPKLYLTTEYDYCVSGDYAWELGKQAFACPLGRPGDMIIVKEQWHIMQEVTPENNEEYKNKNSLVFTSDYIPQYEYDNNKSLQLVYRSHVRGKNNTIGYPVYVEEDQWKEAEVMPNWASRLTLVIDKITPEKENSGKYFWKINYSSFIKVGSGERR